jgi:hypothetical protein
MKTGSGLSRRRLLQAALVAPAALAGWATHLGHAGCKRRGHAVLAHGRRPHRDCTKSRQVLPLA